MNDSTLIASFRNVKVWKQGTEIAPHKPLLMLYVLGRYVSGSARLIPFSEVDAPLRKLLERFGPSRKSYHSEYPFWRLQNDGLWELSNADNLESRKGNTDPKKSELLKSGTSGGFTESIYRAIKSDRSLAKIIATALLERHFPSLPHQQIVEAVGLNDRMNEEHIAIAQSISAD